MGLRQYLIRRLIRYLSRHLNRHCEGEVFLINYRLINDKTESLDFTEELNKN